MVEGNLKSAAQRLLAGVGLPHEDVIHEALPPEHFGDGEVVFRIGPLLVRFVRERGENFVDVGPSSTPGEFHRYGEVELAMGWKTAEQAWSRSEPEPLPAIMERLRNRYEQLAEAYWSANARDTLAKLDDARDLRAARVLFHLRRLVAEAEKVTSGRSAQGSSPKYFTVGKSQVVRRDRNAVPCEPVPKWSRREGFRLGEERFRATDHACAGLMHSNIKNEKLAVSQLIEPRSSPIASSKMTTERAGAQRDSEAAEDSVEPTF